MEQVGLIPSGVQLWAKNMVAARSLDDPEEVGSNISSSLIAFCSSLAVFVLDASTGTVRQILAGYEGLLSALCWSPYEVDILATASQDGSLVLWSIGEEKRVAVVRLRQAPSCMTWFPRPDARCVAVATVRGSIILWNADKRSHSVLLRSELPNNLGLKDAKEWKETHQATVMRCNSKGEIACGFKGGRILLISVEERALSPQAGKAGKSTGETDIPSTRRVCEFYFERDTDVKKNKKKTKQNKEPEPNPSKGSILPDMSVRDLQWDPFSPDYLLAAYQGCPEICMWDCSGDGRPRVAQTFTLPLRMGGAVSLEWQVWAPGCFMSVSEKGAGVMHVWNVSQKQPIDMLQVSTGGASVAAFRCWGSLCAVALDNGAVMAYNARRRLRMARTKASHRETVFDVRFCPDDCNVLASCSFDGRVKIWNTSNGKNECLKTLRHKDRPILYSISWCPDLRKARAGKGRKLIMSGGYNGVVSVWDTNGVGNGQLLSSVKLHNQPIYRVDWNQRDPRLIASSSSDHELIISSVDLDTGEAKKKIKFSHPSKCFGCAWSPHYPQWDGLGLSLTAEQDISLPLVATGCQDGCVHVWDVEAAKKRYILRKHDTKIFNVAWNPIRPGVLASGSDDKKIIVWTLPVSRGYTRASSSECIKPGVEFVGHTRNVRALLWSSELEHILVSGSWDGTIKVWNTALGILLNTVFDHHADVYGLDAHPQRPFCLVSSSRDTTIRFWQLNEPALIEQAGLELVSHICLGGDRHGRIHESGAVQNALKGAAGRAMLDEMRAIAGDADAEDVRSKVQCLTLVLGFFRAKDSGLADLWQMARGATGSKHKVDMAAAAAVTPSPHSQVLSEGRTVYDCAELVRTHLEEKVVNPKRIRSSAASSAAYVEALTKAGEFRAACEYFRENAQWDKALALAPAVSIEYWRELNQAHAELKQHTEPEAAVQRLLAAGCTDQAIDLYCAREEFDEALLLAQMSLNKARDRKTTGCSHYQRASNNDDVVEHFRAQQAQQAEQSALVQSRTDERDALAKERAKSFLRRGHPIMAACCLLGAGDANAAVSALLLAGEEALALIVATLFAKQANGSVGDYVLKAFAAKCERVGAVELALQVLRRTQHAASEVCLLTCRFNFSKSSRAALGLRQTEQYLKQGREADARQNQDLIQMLQFLCASHNVGAQIRAVCVGVDCLCRMLREPAWDISRAMSILRIIQCVDIPAVLSENLTEKYLLIALSSFLGAMQAIWQQYDEIVSPLCKSARAMLVLHPKIDFPFSLQDIAYMESKYLFNRAARSAEANVKSALLAQAKSIVLGALGKSNESLEGKEFNGKSAKIAEKALKDDKTDLLNALESKIDRLAATDVPEWMVAAAKAASRRLGTVSVSSNALPNGNTRFGKRSMFDGKFINGQSLDLCAGKALYLSMAQAVLWAKVNPFSPANTGAKLFNPFGSGDLREDPPLEEKEEFSSSSTVPETTSIAPTTMMNKVLMVAHSEDGEESRAHK